jgi:NAD(P)H dehydrogenase (quinone)
VAVLTGAGQPKESYELAGDVPFTMAELAAELSRQAGKAIRYQDLPAAEYEAVLTGAGLPAPFAKILADSDVCAAQGDLDDSTGELRRLIGRPTTTLAVAVAAALQR